MNGPAFQAHRVLINRSPFRPHRYSTQGFWPVQFYLPVQFP